MEQPMVPQPSEGDTVHIVGHGPAVLVAVSPDGQRGTKKFKVRYPDGSTCHVGMDQILVHEQPPANFPGRRISTSAPGSPDSAPSSAVNPCSSPRGPRRLEYLGRAFDDENRIIRTPSATFSLVATMVGGGVLSLPYAMSQCGFVLGTAAMLLSAVCSAWTLDMLVECARCTGRDTFELVGHAAYGETSRRITVALVFIICWLSMIAYFVLLGDLLVPATEMFIPSLKNQGAESVRMGIVSVAAILLSPMCFKSNLSALRFLCFASVTSVVFVGCVIAVRATEHLGESHIVEIQHSDRSVEQVLISATYLMFPADWAQALYVFPMFGVSFLCHFNALPTHQELARPTRQRMRRVFAMTVGITTVLYLCVGIFGYMFGGICTCGNILLNFSETDSLVTVGRAALGLVLMLNFPLICQPCRNSLFRLLLNSPRLKKLLVGEPGTPDCVSSASNALGEEAGDAPVARINSMVLVDATPGGASMQEFHAEREPAERQSIASEQKPEEQLAASGTRSKERESSPPRRQTSPSDTARVHVYRREDTRGMMYQGETLEPYDQFLPKDETMLQGSLEPTPCQRFIFTSSLLVTALLVSFYMKSILVVWSILGSTVAFLIAFILPALFWYRIVGPTSKPWRRKAAMVLLVISCILAVACTILTCLRLDAPPCPKAPVQLLQTMD